MGNRGSIICKIHLFKIERVDRFNFFDLGDFMKKKMIISISIFLIIIISIICFFIYVSQPSKIDIENRKYVDKYSKIEMFLEEKDEYHQLAVGKYIKNDFDSTSYHRDIDDVLFEQMCNINYEEVALDYEGLNVLYDISMIRKKEYIDVAPRSRYIVVWLYDNNTIRVLTQIGEAFHCDYKARMYRIDEEDYSKIIDEIEKIMANDSVVQETL